MKTLTKKCNTCNEIFSLKKFQPNQGGYLSCRSSCIDCEKDRKRLHYLKNRNKILADKKTYTAANKEKIKAKNYYYCKNRLKTDNLFRLRINIARLIRSSINTCGYSKKSKTINILNCSICHFKAHLESQFQPGMSWDNYGQWHIDHIVPISQAQNENELIKLNSYINLRPLWAKDNLAKSNNKTDIAEKLCTSILDRNWIE